MSLKISFIRRRCWGPQLWLEGPSRSIGRNCRSSSIRPWRSVLPVSTGTCTITGMPRPGRDWRKGAIRSTSVSSFVWIATAGINKWSIT
ncbi:hypothetical protein D9M71_596930 [compost metagenome]